MAVMDRATLGWLRRAAVCADALALAGAWWLWVHARAALHPHLPVEQLSLQPVDVDTQLGLGLLVVPVFVAVLWSRGAWHALRRSSWLDHARDLTLSVGLATVLLGALVFALGLAEASRTVLGGFALSTVPLLLASRAAQLTVLRALRVRNFDPHQILVVGELAGAQMLVQATARRPEWGVAVLGRLSLESGDQETSDDCPWLGTVDTLAAQAGTGVQEVYVTAAAAEPARLAEVSDVCDAIGATMSVEASFLGLRAERAELTEVGGWPVLTFPPSPHSPVALAGKRALDVAGALALALAALPLMVGIAAVVRLVDGGPALFRQERVGRFGRTFTMWKFRSMTPDAERKRAELEALNEVEGHAFKMERDPRITAVGHWLRRSSLDELPQLWNVLRGDMSLVGPRPPLASEVAQYERWQLRRLSVTPGLTGLWQVSGRADLPFDRWVELDLEYIDNWSLWLDVRLLVRTLPAVIRGTGAR